MERGTKLGVGGENGEGEREGEGKKEKRGKGGSKSLYRLFFPPYWLLHFYSPTHLTVLDQLQYDGGGGCLPTNKQFSELGALQVNSVQKLSART